MAARFWQDRQLTGVSIRARSSTKTQGPSSSLYTHVASGWSPGARPTFPLSETNNERCIAPPPAPSAGSIERNGSLRDGRPPSGVPRSRTCQLGIDTTEDPANVIGNVGSDKHDAPADIAAWIAAAAPEGTAGAVDRISPSAPFDAAEEAAIARAVPRRRAEFATGRRLAREALARLGCLAASLPPDSAGMPQWPTGFVGTISHSGQLCVAVVGRAHNLLGIGIDLEEIGPLQHG